MESKKTQVDHWPPHVCIWMYSPECLVAGREKDVLGFIFNCTYLENRRKHRMSNGYIAKGLGLRACNVSGLVNSLKKKGLIKCEIVRGTRVIHLCKKKYRIKEDKGQSSTNPIVPKTEAPEPSHEVNPDNTKKQTDNEQSGIDSILPTKQYETYTEGTMKFIPNTCSQTEERKMPEKVETKNSPENNPAFEVKKGRDKTLEEQFASFAVRHGFPPYETEYKFLPDRKFRADFAWPDHKLLVEVDGGKHINGHHHTAEGIKRDQERDRLAREAGFHVVRTDRDGLEGDQLYSLVSAFLSCPKDEIPDPIALDRCTSSDASMNGYTSIINAIPKAANLNGNACIWLAKQNPLARRKIGFKMDDIVAAYMSSSEYKESLL